MLQHVNEYTQSMRLLIVVFFIALLSCSTETETETEEEKIKFRLISELTDRCTDEFYSQGIYSKKTGEQITEESDTLHFRMAVKGTCRAKVELFFEGYNVLPIIQYDDLRKFIMVKRDGLRSHYKSMK